MQTEKRAVRKASQTEAWVCWAGCLWGDVFLCRALLYLSRLWRTRAKVVNAVLPRVSHRLATGTGSHHPWWLPSSPASSKADLWQPRREGREKWQGHLRSNFGSINNVISEQKGFVCKPFPNNFKEVSEGQIAQERTDAVIFRTLRCRSWEGQFRSLHCWNKSVLEINVSIFFSFRHSFKMYRKFWFRKPKILYY